MDLGDLAGWIAAAVAIAAAGIAWWAASSADSQARSARAQAIEAERSRKAAEKQVEQAEESLSLARREYEAATEQQRITDQKEAHRAVLAIARSMSERQRAFFTLAYHTRRSSEPADETVQPFLDLSASSGLDQVDALSTLVPMMNRLPFSAEVLSIIHSMTEKNDVEKHSGKPAPDILDAISENSREASEAIRMVATAWAQEQDW